MEPFVEGYLIVVEKNELTSLIHYALQLQLKWNEVYTLDKGRVYVLIHDTLRLYHKLNLVYVIIILNLDTT